MTRRRFLPLLLSLALLCASALPVSAGCNCLTGGFIVPMTVTPYTTPDGSAACTTYFKVWLQELGTSGITRLRAKFQLRGANDPGIPGLAYQEAGWFASGEFPDDYRSYYAIFAASFNTYRGGRYAVHATFIGERPGLWRPDRKLEVVLRGDAGCFGIEGGG